MQEAHWLPISVLLDHGQVGVQTDAHCGIKGHLEGSSVVLGADHGPQLLAVHSLLDLLEELLEGLLVGVCLELQPQAHEGDSFIHPLIHPLTYSLTRLLAGSPTHPLTHSLTHSTFSLILSLITQHQAASGSMLYKVSLAAYCPLLQLLCLPVTTRTNDKTYLILPRNEGPEMKGGGS